MLLYTCIIYIPNTFTVPPSTPTNFTLLSQSPTSITLSWEQPAGDVVDTYNIVYTVQGGCSDYTQPENMATVNDGTAREYTLQNLQEFSCYNISVTAVNGGGSSPAATATATTAPSGDYITLNCQFPVHKIILYIPQLPVVLLNL